MTTQDDLLQIFLLESDDLLKMAEASLLALESAPQGAVPIDELFRSIHTLKSSAAMVGLLPLSEYAHHLENLLERLRSHKLAISKNLITFLLESVDFIRMLIEQVVSTGAELDLGGLAQRQDQIKRYLGLETVAVQDERKPPSVQGATTVSEIDTRPSAALRKRRFLQIRMHFRKDIFHSGRDPLLTLFNLSEVGELVRVTTDLSALPPFMELDPYQLYLSWEVTLATEHTDAEILQEVFFFLKEDNDIRIEDVSGHYLDGIDARLAHESLGELLVQRGDVTPADVVEALGAQKRLGEILVEKGVLEPVALQQAVAVQDESRTQYRQATIRVTVDKLNNLVTLAEETGIGLSRLQVMLQRLGLSSTGELMEELETLLKINREFQERVARVRLFPLDGTFRRFQRMARDLALQQNKLVKVVVTGLENELDKEVIEHITDPLKHLVRNCVDHGIETAEERLAKNKPAEASIELRAYQREGRIHIEVHDDGRGLDWVAIHRKAVQQNLITADQPVHPDVLLPLVFRPGFSSRTDLTELSGRGVGLDVVRTGLDRLGGTIAVTTEKDVGTTFALSLPLTFSLMDVLHVHMDRQSYLIPLQCIVGTEKFQPESIRLLGQDEALYRFREAYVPLVDLSRTFAHIHEFQPNTRPILVFLHTGARTLGVPVDELLEPQQIVIKSLETNFRSVTGFAGAAMLGDGSVALVLDPLGLEQLCFEPVIRN